MRLPAGVDGSLLIVAAGALLVGIGQVDLYFTVLQYQGYGFLSRWLYRGIWSAARVLSAPLPGRQRPRVLAGLGPLMVAASLVLWIGLSLIGFALIYYPSFRANFSLKPGVEAGLLDAVYASGVALSTVGFGDVTPTTPVYQLLTVLESLLGFSILTLAISYVVGIYGVVSLQGELGAGIHDRVGRADDPSRLARTYAEPGRESMESALASLHRDVLRYHEGLLRYPIVYYFHSGHEFRSMPYVVSMVGGAVAALRWGLPTCHPLRSSPALRALISALRRVTGDVSDAFEGSVLNVGFDPTCPADQANERREALLRRRFQRVEEALGASAQDCPADDRPRRYAAWRAFSEDIRHFVASAAGDLGYRQERFARESPRG